MTFRGVEILQGVERGFASSLWRKERRKVEKISRLVPFEYQREVNIYSEEI